MAQQQQPQPPLSYHTLPTLFQLTPEGLQGVTQQRNSVTGTNFANPGGHVYQLLNQLQRSQNNRRRMEELQQNITELEEALAAAIDRCGNNVDNGEELARCRERVEELNNRIGPLQNQINDLQAQVQELQGQLQVFQITWNDFNREITTIEQNPGAIDNFMQRNLTLIGDQPTQRVASLLQGLDIALTQQFTGLLQQIAIPENDLDQARERIFRMTARVSELCNANAMVVRQRIAQLAAMVQNGQLPTVEFIEELDRRLATLRQDVDADDLIAIRNDLVAQVNERMEQAQQDHEMQQQQQPIVQYQPQPQPIVQYQPQPQPQQLIVQPQPQPQQPVVQYQPQPQQPIVQYQPQPIVQPQPQPIVQYQPQPQPIIQPQPQPQQPIVQPQPQPQQPVVQYQPQPQPQPQPPELQYRFQHVEDRTNEFKQLFDEIFQREGADEYKSQIQRSWDDVTTDNTVKFTQRLWLCAMLLVTLRYYFVENNGIRVYYSIDGKDLKINPDGKLVLPNTDVVFCTKTIGGNDGNVYKCGAPYMTVGQTINSASMWEAAFLRIYDMLTNGLFTATCGLHGEFPSGLKTQSTQAASPKYKSLLTKALDGMSVNSSLFLDGRISLILKEIGVIVKRAKENVQNEC
jgi:hypothetical protein